MKNLCKMILNKNEKLQKLQLKREQEKQKITILLERPPLPKYDVETLLSAGKVEIDTIAINNEKISKQRKGIKHVKICRDFYGSIFQKQMQKASYIIFLRITDVLIIQRNDFILLIRPSTHVT